MTYRAVLSALNEKKAIIQRTDDDHWLYEPISEAVDLIEELQVYKKALELMAEDSTNSSLNEDKQELIDYYLEKAREE